MTLRRWFLGSIVATAATAVWSYLYWLTPLARSGAVPRIDNPTVVLGILTHLGLSCLLIATLLRAVVRALPWYSQRVGFVLFAGVAASFWSRTGPSLWLGAPFADQGVAMLHDLGTWLVAGIVLARFITERVR